MTGYKHTFKQEVDLSLTFFSETSAMEKRSAGLSKSCTLIIVVASVERFAFKGVASNLVTYLTDVVKLSTSSAAKSVSTWSGVTSMLPLVSAILADSYWDRYSTIMASSLLYVVGLVALTSWAVLSTWMPTSSLYLPLYLISIGQAGYNPTLQAFGADQLEIQDELPCCQEQESSSKKKSLFFQWWYFGICSGSLLGNSVMPYIQDTFGWGLGFAIPAFSMTFSVACFLLGTRFYVHKQLQIDRKLSESVFQSVKGVATKMIPQKLRRQSPTNPDAIELELQEKPFQDDFDCSKSLDVNFSNADEQPRVAKVILRLLPVWMMLLMFAVIFQQPATFFTKQGMAMKHRIRNGFVIPPAMLQSALTISIVMLMPLYDRTIIPILRLITRDDKGITVIQRIGIGMVFSIVAMVVAATVERKRLDITRRVLNVASESSDMQLSIFWLLPQYVLLGISDVFTVVGMQEFFYTQVPSTMRTIGISLYLSVFGFGSFLSALLISVIELVTGASGTDDSWFSDDMSKARLDNYYWFLALLSTVSFILFASFCRFYKDYSDSGNRSQS